MPELEMTKPKCYGYHHELKPCEYIDTCELCINNTYCDDICNIYILVRGALGMKCKRDNPDFNGFTKQQIFEIYKQLQKREPISVTEILDFAKIEGILIEE